MKTQLALNRRHVLHTLGAAGLGVALPAAAQQGFPSRPLRVVLGLPAGGAADVVIRLMGEQLARALGQPVLIENRPGGLYQLAVQTVLGQPADGHTLMYVNSSFAAVQAVHQRFDLTRDFLPLLKVNETPGLVVVSANSPFKTIKELLDYGRAHPKKLTYGILGAGSYEHLSGLAFEQAAGFEGLAVPYKGGPEMVNAVMAGDLHFTMINVVTAMQFIPYRKLRALATRDSERVKSLPDVPTLAEAGAALPLSRLWGGYVVRAGTPPAVVQRLQKEIRTALETPAVAEKLKGFGLISDFSRSSDEFSRLIQSEVTTMAALGKRLDFNRN